jgi:hypothetical protein
MSGVPIIKFLFRSECKILNEALGSHPPAEVLNFHDEKVLVQIIKNYSAALVIVSLEKKNDLLKLVDFFKLLKKQPKTTYLKIMVINSSSDSALGNAANKLDISDLVTDKIQDSVLKFKINFHLRSIQVHLKNTNDREVSTNAQSDQAAIAEKRKIKESIPQLTEALGSHDDIWILKHYQDCKKVLNRWLIRLLGPSPFVAQWVETGTEGVWEFKFKSEDNIFVSGKGHWYFYGEDKPDFDWTENTWLLKGEFFELFHKDGDVYSSRVRLKDKILRVAKNSEYAKAKLKEIIESFDRDLVYKRDFFARSKSETIDKEVERYDDLSGRSNTEHISNEILKGKDKTDVINSDLLRSLNRKGELDQHQEHLFDNIANSKVINIWEGEYDPSQRIEQGENLDIKANNVYEKFYRGHTTHETYKSDDVNKKQGLGIDNDQLIGTNKDQNLRQGKVDNIDNYLRGPDAKKNQKISDRDQDKELYLKIGKEDEEGFLNSFSKKIKTSSDSSGPEDSRVKDSKELKYLGGFQNSKSKEEDVFRLKHLKNGSQQINELPDSSDKDALPGMSELSKNLNQELPPDLAEAVETAKVTCILEQDSLKINCQLDDYFDQTVVFTTKQPGIVETKMVLLNLNFDYMKKDTILSIEGKVTQIDQGEEGVIFITIEIPSENLSAFDSFIELYKTRQKNIDLFIKTAKGL